MTLGEAVARFDATRENDLTSAEKIRLISSLDGRVFDTVCSRYENAGTFHGYSADADLTTALLVPYPYDDVYLVYLLALNSLYEGNSAEYDNFSALYNTLLAEYGRAYHASHGVKTVKLRQPGEANECCRR